MDPVRQINKAERSDHLTRIREIILQCDTERKGYLSIDDLQVAMVAILGYKACKDELQKLLSPQVNFQGILFSACENMLLQKLQNCDINEEIREIFMAFDINCRGFLTMNDIMTIFEEVAPSIPKATILSIFRNIDFDEDGRVSYRDFEYVMRLQLDSME